MPEDVIAALSTIEQLVGPEGMSELLQLLLQDLGTGPDEIRAAAAASDWRTLERRAHRMLGSARYIGFAPLTAILLTIETAARGRTSEAASIAALEDETRGVCRTLLDWQSRHLG